MSFKTAFASCWDICKFNCTNGDKPFYFLDSYRNWRSGPNFTLDLYETYFSYSDRVFPYNEKPPANPDSKRGLTEPDDKLVSSFLGWIFTVPEVLTWSALAIGKGLLSAFLLLVFTGVILAAPLFLLSREMRERRYKYILKDILDFLGGTTAFALLALLRVPYHLIKAIIRIPVGIGIAVKEIVSPTPVRQRVIQAVPASIEAWEEQLQETERRYLRLQNIVDNDVARVQTNSMNTNVSSSIVEVPKTENNSWENWIDKLKITEDASRYTRYICSISKCLMNLPFLIGDGNIYDKEFIQLWANKQTSPLNGNALPITAQPGIILENIKGETSAFVIALRANDHLMKIKGDEQVNKQDNIFKIAEEVSQQSVIIREQINFYIKELRSSENVEALAKDMTEKLNLSSKMIATAWTHIETLTTQATPDNFLKVTMNKFSQFINMIAAWTHIEALTTQATPDNFLTLAPEVAMNKFLGSINEMDASLDNFVIAALREAILEEQQVSKRFYESWDFDQLTQGELFERLSGYMPLEIQLDNLNEVVAMTTDSAISNNALQYTLKLIKAPETAENFDQFEAEEKDKCAVVKEFLQAYYEPENEPFRMLFLITLKETILREQCLNQLQNSLSTFEVPGFKPQPPLWKEPPVSVIAKTSANTLQKVSTSSLLLTQNTTI